MVLRNLRPRYHRRLRKRLSIIPNHRRGSWLRTNYFRFESPEAFKKWIRYLLLTFKSFTDRGCPKLTILYPSLKNLQSISTNPDIPCFIQFNLCYRLPFIINTTKGFGLQLRFSNPRILKAQGM